MITLFVIGIIVFMVKPIRFTCRAAWEITEGILFVMKLPTPLIVFFIAGLVSLALSLLVLALLVLFPAGFERKLRT